MIANGVLFFYIAVIGYLLAFFFLLFSFVFKRSSLGRAGTVGFAVGFVAQTLGLILRSISLKTLPVTNTYESLVFYGWVFALGYLVMAGMSRRSPRPIRVVGTLIALFSTAAIALASSPLYSPTLQPLVPALRSHWLILHVSFTFIGEGFFAVSFASSLLFLILERRGRKRRNISTVRTSALERLDALSYKAVAIGFPFFTLGGLFFGAIWAKHAWGRYWGWDPKETFMLVTWLVYVLYLHARLRRGWRGRRAAWIAVVGFLLALFTFAGVNYLVRGLHSYR